MTLHFNKKEKLSSPWWWKVFKAFIHNQAFYFVAESLSTSAESYKLNDST